MQAIATIGLDIAYCRRSVTGSSSGRRRYVKRQQNDATNAEAICETVGRPIGQLLTRRAAVNILLGR